MNGNHSRRVERGLQLVVGVALTMGLALAAVACSDEGGSGDGPLIVATHSLLGDLAVNVFGDEAEVQVVMPAGTDPHEFEPSAAQVAMLNEADLVVANGLGFEVGLTDALDAAAADGSLEHAVRVAVHSEEAPLALLARADLVVDGPDGLADLLRQLARDLG